MKTIEIDGLFNVRASALDAPWLLRSGAIDDVTPTGIERLHRLGVSVIVDLREPGEAELGRHGIHIASVPIYGAEPPRFGSIEGVYSALLRDRGDALTRAVGEIADAEHAALVHCTAGKDRTGLVVALALLAAGVGADDVIADYALSASDVRRARAAIAHDIADRGVVGRREETLRLHLESPPEAMRHALRIVAERGGAATYLLEHGLSAGQLAALRRKHRAAR